MKLVNIKKMGRKCPITPKKVGGGGDIRDSLIFCKYFQRAF